MGTPETAKEEKPVTAPSGDKESVSATSPGPAWDEDYSDPYAWRKWMFGDAHAESHNFADTFIQRAPKEIACAAAASVLVSPIVSIIDKCIVQDVFGSKQFAQAAAGATKEMIFQPKQFFGGLSFTLTVAVYFGTYAVANLSELALDMAKEKNDDMRKTIKVGASSAANIGLLAWRDSVFAKEFSLTAKHATPIRTLGLFAARDSATMYATFYAAPRAAVYLQEEFEVERNVAELSTALAIPAGIQVLTAPLHIHAMDYYARPVVNNGWGDRMVVVKGEFATVAIARSMRILPAFGLGSFSNNRFRDLLIRHEDEDMPRLQRRITQLVQREKTRLLGRDS